MQTQGRSCSYRYDALDRLASLSSERSTLRRFYCADRLATQSDGDRHHSYLQASGRLLAQRDSTVDGVQSMLLATDGANSVLAAGSDPLTSFAYNPYGHRGSATLPSGLPGFNGEQPDPLTGHYLLGNGYRAFNPVLMRFNSPDNISPFKGGGLNPYAYCLGDPINRVDPTGHMSWQAGLGLGLSVFGILASVATFGAATPLAVAGIAASAASLGAGVGQAVTEDTNPGLSSALGWTALGLGVVSSGLGAAAQFKKITSRLYQKLHVPMTSDGRRYSFLQRSAVQPAQPNNLSRQEQAIRDVTRNTKGNQLLRFMELDESFKRQVPRHLRTSAVSGRADMFSQDSIYRLRRIALGEERGYLPSQVLDYENLKLMAEELPEGGFFEDERARLVAYFGAMHRLDRV